MANETLNLPSVPTLPTSALTIDDGDASAPSISFTDDTDNGLFWSTVNKISASVGGTAAINWKDDIVDMMLPVNFSDVTAPAAPSGATNGYLYKKTGSDRLYWKTLGAGEFDLTSTMSSEFKDSEFKIYDETNTNRKIRFDLDSLTTDSDHTWVMPSSTVVLPILPNATSLSINSNDIGASSLGNNNTFYGYIPFSAGSITGVGNICYGRNSGKALSSGDYNTMIGYQVAQFLNTTDYNTLIGGQAHGGTSLGTGLTGMGDNAISSVTGNYNTGLGYRALRYTTSTGNVAIGHESMDGSSSSSTSNTCVGRDAMGSTSSGDYNVCFGSGAGESISSGSNNVILGYSSNVTSGSLSNNLLIGYDLSSSVSNSIMIGHMTNNTTNFQAGIRGVTTGNADAIAVLVDSAGQLGTVSSSRRYKENINYDINVDNLYNLTPASFNYKTDESKKMTYGLIAEEVEEVLSDIVVYKEVDGENVPDTVQYHLLAPLLLSMIISQKNIIDELNNKLDVVENV